MRWLSGQVLQWSADHRLLWSPLKHHIHTSLQRDLMRRISACPNYKGTLIKTSTPDTNMMPAISLCKRQDILDSTFFKWVLWTRKIIRQLSFSMCLSHSLCAAPVSLCFYVSPSLHNPYGIFSFLLLQKGLAISSNTYTVLAQPSKHTNPFNINRARHMNINHVRSMRLALKAWQCILPVPLGKWTQVQDTGHLHLH